MTLAGPIMLLRLLTVAQFTWLSPSKPERTAPPPPKNQGNSLKKSNERRDESLHFHDEIHHGVQCGHLMGSPPQEGHSEAGIVSVARTAWFTNIGRESQGSWKTSDGIDSWRDSDTSGCRCASRGHRCRNRKNQGSMKRTTPTS